MEGGGTMNVSTIASSTNSYALSIGQQNNQKAQKHNGNHKNSMLDQLMEQKDNLSKRKSKLYDDALEKGNTEDVKDEMKEIDKQIEDVNKQITELQQEATKKGLNKNDKKEDKDKENSKESSEGTTAEGQNTQAMNNLLGVYGDIKAGKMLFSQRHNMKDQAKVLESEIKQDAARGVDTSKKTAYLNGMEDGIKNIDKKVGEKLKKINKQDDNSDSNLKDKSRYTVGNNIDNVA